VASLARPGENPPTNDRVDLIEAGVPAWPEARFRDLATTSCWHTQKKAISEFGSKEGPYLTLVMPTAQYFRETA
jgi:hypothetical protein